MSFKDSKVVIIGAGNVGSTTAYSILNQGISEQVVLIDKNQDVAYAQALDMAHSIYFMNRNMSIKAGDYSDCRDADVVVITAAAPMPKDSTNRLEMLAPSMNIIKDIVNNVMSNGFDGVFVVISNPVDIMSYYVWKLSHLPVNRIIGSGTALDTARLCYELSKMYNLDAKSVEAFVMAEHGDSEMVLWSSATIGGKPLDDVFADNADRTKNVTKDDLLKMTKQAGWDIFAKKGNTCYGIASSATAIIKSILFNENRILPVSVGLSGQYGLNNLFLSVPTIINKNGAKEIVEIKLNDEEESLLKKSAETLTSFYKELNI